MRRSLKGLFTVPDKVKDVPTSKELKDLLHRILKPAPSERASMQDIWQHPWFQINLPPAAETLNEQIMQEHQHAGWQSQQQIRQVWAEASRPAAVAEDELITDTIEDFDVDEEENQTHYDTHTASKDP